MDSATLYLGTLRLLAEQNVRLLDAVLCYNGECDKFLAAGKGVPVDILGGIAGERVRGGQGDDRKVVDSGASRDGCSCCCHGERQEPGDGGCEGGSGDVRAAGGGGEGEARVESAGARSDGGGGVEGVLPQVGGHGPGVSGAAEVAGGQTGVGRHYLKNKKKKEKVKALKAEARARAAVGSEKFFRMQQSWRGGYCETVASDRPRPQGASPVSSSASSRTLVEAKQAAEESLARRRVMENELAIVKTKAQIASYADVEKSKAIAELKIARIAQWNNEARMKSQKSWADYKRSLESSPVPSFKASDLPSAASAGEYWWKQQCLKSKEMEEQIKHLEAVLKASMPYVSPEGLEKMREVPDPEPVIDPEFEALKRAHRELAAAEGLDGYDSGDDMGYDLFMPPSNL